MSMESNSLRRTSQRPRLDGKALAQELRDSLNRAVLEEHVNSIALALFEKLNEPIRSKRAPKYSSNHSFFESVPGFDPENNKPEIG